MATAPSSPHKKVSSLLSIISIYTTQLLIKLIQVKTNLAIASEMNTIERAQMTFTSPLASSCEYLMCSSESQGGGPVPVAEQDYPGECTKCLFIYLLQFLTSLLLFLCNVCTLSIQIQLNHITSFPIMHI